MKRILLISSGIVILLSGLTRLVIAITPSERKQLADFKVSTLKGMPGVAVTVKIVRDNPETLSLLKESELTGEVEIALQAAGVQVLRPTRDVGLYVVIAEVSGGGPDIVNLAVSVQSSVLQIVQLTRDSTIKTEAQTWPSVGQGRFGLVPLAMAKSVITRTVKEQAKEFAGDYKAANPKPDHNP
jgi:hypothetical protein